MTACLTTSLLSLTVLTLALPLAAQEWNLSAHAGRIRSALDPATRATESFAVGLRYDDPFTGFRLSAGVPRTAREPLWGGLGAWRRFAVRRSGWLAGIDAQGSAFLAHEREASSTPGVPGPLDPPLEPVVERSGHALAAQVLPVVGYESATVQVHARAGVSRYTAAFGAAQLSRSVRLADVQLALNPTSAFAIVPVVRHFRAPNETPATYVGASVVAAAKLGSVWAASGAWTGRRGGTSSVPWSLGARLRMHPRVALEAATRRDAFDPLYLQPPQTSWSLGLSVQIGRRTTLTAAPVPAHYADGRATIRLKARPGQPTVSIAGDFNGWKAAPMQRYGSDWVFTIAVRPGVYHYAFVDADGEWFVPEDVAGRRDDGMGGHVAVLVVQ